MKATGHMQSKWRPKGVKLTLHGTFHEPQKNEIHLLYLHFVFYIVFGHYLWYFDLNLANKIVCEIFI